MNSVKPNTSMTKPVVAAALCTWCSTSRSTRAPDGCAAVLAPRVDSVLPTRISRM